MSAKRLFPAPSYWASPLGSTEKLRSQKPWPSQIKIPGNTAADYPSCFRPIHPFIFTIMHYSEIPNQSTRAAIEATMYVFRKRGL